MVIHDQEQLCPHRGVDPRVWNEWPDEDVGDPALVRPRSFVAAEDLRLCAERLARQAGPAQLGPHRPLRDGDPVPVEQDGRDLGRRAARQLETQRRCLVGQLGVGAHCSGVGSGRGGEPLQTGQTIGVDPAVDGPPRVAPFGAVGVRVGAQGDLANQGASLGMAEPFVRSLRDHPPAMQSDLLSLVGIHVILLPFRPLGALEA